MQKTTNILLLLILVSLAVLPRLPEGMGGAVATFNIPDYSVDTVTHTTATTSASALPVKILDSNLFRQNVKIINNSDTILYIGLTSASSTVLEDTGIRLSASGGDYEIDQDNLYTGEIWVSSSTPDKLLLISEI